MTVAQYTTASNDNKPRMDGPRINPPHSYYAYDLLPKPNDSCFFTRSITLLPGNDADEVKVSLAPLRTDVTSRSRCSFHALSYAWGDTVEYKRIIVKDGNGDSALDIGLNLHAALLELRCEQPLQLWADAICINQSPKTSEEEEEKAFLVKKMHDIYGRCQSVIIWLGPASADSGLAMAVLRELANGLEFNELTYETSTRAKRIQIMDEEMSEAVAILLRRPWFYRVWVRQEAFVATAESIIRCGHESLSIEQFRRACQAMSLMPLNEYANRDRFFPNSVTHAAEVFRHAFSAITSILYRVRGAECKYLQDKVYGSLGMLATCGQASFAAGVVVDYNKSPANVYRDVFVHYLESKYQLSMLYYAGLTQRSSLSLPSWVPDWSVQYFNPELDLQVACSHAKYAEAKVIDDNTLQVYGVLASPVCKVISHDKTMKLPIKYTMAQMFHCLCDFLGLDTNTTDDALVMVSDAFCLIFYNLAYSIEDIRLQHLDFLTMFRRFMVCRREHYSMVDLENQVQLRHADTVASSERTLRAFSGSDIPWIKLENGDIGIGCRDIMVGDIASVLLGLVNVVALRLVQNTQYQLVGSIFTQSLNHGQALLGPLPADVEIVPRLVPAWGHFVPYYVNKTTQQSSFYDPRVEWSELTTYIGMTGFPIINAPPDETSPARQMPTVAYFRRHGVDIKDIHVV